LDVGGVLGTNGWGRESRKAAAETFGLDLAEMDQRHHLTFDTYEAGKLSLEGYLDRIVFYEPRPFTKAKFTEFMLSRSQPYPEMLSFITRLKEKFRLRIVVVSNEARELTLHRVDSFGLKKFVDAFIFSCFVHLRKPDVDIFRLALDVSLVSPDRVLYIDDRPMFVEAAHTLGIRGIVHDAKNLAATVDKLASFGLKLD
jgi:putative hydrolase of the HAD superfamily